ncbi:MAG: BadF/BadG/BcrA/BcrD ATPase family protein [Sarcina sp.]
MNYIIGVDGGGTKTEAVAYDLDGNVLKVALKGFGNPLNNKEEALRNINDSIKELTDEYGLEDLKGLYLGIAGSESSENTKLIKEVADKFFANSVVMNDGELALRAMLKGEDGILTIAGTGSISFGVNGEKRARCGGWGHLLGDEGSAYKISIDAIKRMIFENDNSIENSPLTDKVMEHLKISNADEVIPFVYSATKDEVAKIAPIVSILAEAGDEICISIMVEEGLELAKTTQNTYKRLGFEKCSIGLVGGVIRKSRVVRETFEKYLAKHINVVSYVDSEVSAAKGAYYIYLKENK